LSGVNLIKFLLVVALEMLLSLGRMNDAKLTGLSLCSTPALPTVLGCEPFGADNSRMSKRSLNGFSAFASSFTQDSVDDLSSENADLSSAVTVRSCTTLFSTYAIEQPLADTLRN
jgi:hypothetical protein